VIQLMSPPLLTRMRRQRLDDITKLRCSKEKRGARATFLILRAEGTAICLLQTTVPSGKPLQELSGLPYGMPLTPRL